MTNIYGYNRKSIEEDERILAAVKHHHEFAESQGYFVVMTALVGSQNYDMDDEYSDIDTFSLVFPPLMDIVLAKEPYSGMIELEDGHCEIKDIRLALSLLRKTSPNSVEYFTSKYKIYNPIFEPILKEYLNDNTKLWDMIHCNYIHMISAIAGMAHQLTKRNMRAGKRFSHAMRLDNMYYHFMNSVNASAVLEFRMGGDRDIAITAKRDQEEKEEYDDACTTIALRLEEYKDNFKLNEE